ncbi:hypothetical protein BDV25DRAFT_164561 [Aspergillus avenaceus]|uniref:Uncharacterized protein n=1 Tax=Aspergillus avenaceus TaxID=36643 RepID=A0A5N6TGR5_ASPAV|nr:hypothetical protein BDV25DRAFT_164561 [Aspergillus avenaceus]
MRFILPSETCTMQKPVLSCFVLSFRIGGKNTPIQKRRPSSLICGLILMTFSILGECSTTQGSRRGKILRF